MAKIKLPKKKTKGKYTLNNIRALFYGPWKIGKSTFCSKFENALFIGTEKGLEALDVYKMYIKNWDEFKQSIELIINGDHDYQTIVIDTVDNAFKFCQEYIKKKFRINHASDLKWGKGWDLLAQEFEAPFLDLSLTDYGILLTSHERETEINKKTMKYTKIGPSFPSAARKVIGPFVDIIGHMYIDEVEVNGKLKERRFIEFAATPYVEAGDRTGLLPDVIPLRYAKFKKYFK
jgi:hypothetical protein